MYILHLFRINLAVISVQDGCKYNYNDKCSVLHLDVHSRVKDLHGCWECDLLFQYPCLTQHTDGV